MRYEKSRIEALVKKFPGVEETPLPEKFVRDPEPQVRVPAASLRAVCEALKADGFDLPVQMTAVDYIKEGQFELVYYLYSTAHREAIVLKARIDRDRPVADSVTPVWGGMNFQEREVFDLMGIRFNGHPQLKRIMMWDGFPGHPLRKDYIHVTDKYDNGLEVGTPGLDAKGIPIESKKA